jgi:GNAT superfamily N-acetyltransferase
VSAQRRSLGEVYRLEGRGVGQAFMKALAGIARTWPADAIRLDAYDAEAGAGGFYRTCGLAERGRVVYRGTPHLYFELLV